VFVIQRLSGTGHFLITTTYRGFLGTEASYLTVVDRDSSVGIVTGYGLDGPGIESRWGVKLSARVQTGPGTHPASCTMSTVSFLWLKNCRCVTLIPHLLLVPWSRKSRAIPLLLLWAVRPVQSLSACTRVQFTFNCDAVFVDVTAASLNAEPKINLLYIPFFCKLPLCDFKFTIYRGNQTKLGLDRYFTKDV